MPYPKVEECVGDRTVIRVIPKADMILFGKRVGDTENCGAYLTNLEEWEMYLRGIGK